MPLPPMPMPPHVALPPQFINPSPNLNHNSIEFDDTDFVHDAEGSE